MEKDVTGREEGGERKSVCEREREDVIRISRRRDSGFQWQPKDTLESLPADNLWIKNTCIEDLEVFGSCIVCSLALQSESCCEIKVARTAFKKIEHWCARACALINTRVCYWRTSDDVVRLVPCHINRLLLHFPPLVSSLQKDALKSLILLEHTL